jgi:hypothetical protein
VSAADLEGVKAFQQRRLEIDRKAKGDSTANAEIRD